MKFNRMGFRFDKHRDVRMVRVGFTMDFNPAATAPAAFGYLVGDFDEEWGDGMSVYHNPNGTHPVPINFFEGFSGRHWFENGNYENLFRDFSPYSSVTATHLIKGNQNELVILDQLLREEADTRASELAEATDDAQYLAWRDKFVG